MQMDAVSMLTDNPVERGEDDLLERRPFAENLTSLILNAPVGSTLRFGVYGGWGEGKTSVLRMMQTTLKSQGVVCVWIAPSLATSKDEVAGSIIRGLAHELGIDIQNLESAKRWVRLFDRAKAASDIDPKVKLVEVLVAPGLENLLGGRIRKAEQAFADEVQQRLNGKKLVVFIDDLDRVKPDLVPLVLLTLREALDYPDYFYVLGLAPDIVETGLSGLNRAWGEPRQFLEKIVELPQYLPQISHATWLRYATNIIKHAGVKVDVGALADIVTYLPANPRRLKLFIRYLASLSEHVKRFGPDGLNLRVFYLTQLLRTEFPREVQSLLEDDETLSDISYAGLSRFVRRTQTSTQREDKPEKQEGKHIEDTHPDRERFLTLCEALRERGGFEFGNVKLRGYLQIPDVLPLVTYYEMVVNANTWLAEPALESRRTMLDSVLTQFAHRSLESVREAWMVLIEVRDRHLGGVVEFDFESDMLAGLEEGLELAHMLNSFAKGDYGFTSGDLGLEEWKALRSHVQNWAHFTKHSGHDALRAYECGLLEQTFALLSAADRAEMYPFLKPEGIVDPTPGALFVQTIARLQSVSRSDAIDAAIMRFELTDGLEVLWGDKRDRLYGLMLLNPNSPIFVDANAYSRFQSTAQKAAQSIVIRRNFLKFFRQLAYGASEGGGFSASDCRELLSNENLVQTIWTAAVAQPLNPRIAGSLRRHRQKLTPALLPSEAMPLPNWWVDLENSGFWQEELTDSQRAVESGEADEP